jgi:hypothetical protein
MRTQARAIARKCAAQPLLRGEMLQAACWPRGCQPLLIFLPPMPLFFMPSRLLMLTRSNAAAPRQRYAVCPANAANAAVYASICYAQQAMPLCWQRRQQQRYDDESLTR